MNCRQRFVAMVFLIGTMGGCAGEIAKPVGLDVALRGVEDDMKAASGVSLHDVLGRDAIQEDEFNRPFFRRSAFTGGPTPLCL